MPQIVVLQTIALQHSRLLRRFHSLLRPPNAQIVRAQSAEGHDCLAILVSRKLVERAGIRDFALVAGELKRHLVGAFHGLPSARLVAGHGAVFLQGDVDGLVHAAIVGARLIGDLLRALEIAGLVVRTIS